MFSQHKTASLVLGALLLCSAAAQAYTPGKTYRFTVLHTNDTHGRFWNNEQGEYGFAAHKTLIDRIRKEVAAQGGQVLLLNAGDYNTGVPESDIQNAKPDVEGMNMLGYEALALGNHEFDHPLSVLQKQKKWAKFPFLSANAFDKKTGKLLAQPYTVLNKGGLKIAVVGLTTEDTAILSTQSDHVRFEPAIKAAKRTLQQLNQKEKPDVRIALTHLGYDHNGQHGANAPGDVSLARSMPKKNAFDLIIGGHSHTTVCLNEDGSLNEKFKPGDECRPDYQNGAWIVQAGEWGKYLGRADFEFKNGQTKLVGYKLIPVNLKQKMKNADGKTEYKLYQEEIPADSAVKAHLQRYQNQGDRLLGIKVGSTQGVFDGSRDAVRRRQTALGRLITAAHRQRMQADVSIMNGGGIRDSLPAGEISYKNILKIQPFGNTLVSVRMKGKELADYLKAVALSDEGSGAYPQFSGNLSMTVDRAAKTVGDIRIDGKALQAEQSYTISLLNFSAKGGDGYPDLRHNPTFVDSGFVDAEVLKDYLSKNPDINPADFQPKDEIVYR